MKSYKQFISESKTDIDFICKKYDIINYTINSDGLIDVNGDVYLSNTGLTNIPLKFRNVTGTFYCSHNKLTSLVGSPKDVRGDFECGHNQLTTLEGSPESVGGNFYCDYNQLTSLVGCPEIINGVLNCRNNRITDFRGISEYYEGDFFCHNNPISEINILFSNSKYIKWINEFDVIQGNKVILDRLEEVFHQLGMDIPENIYLPSYEII